MSWRRDCGGFKCGSVIIEGSIPGDRINRDSLDELLREAFADERVQKVVCELDCIESPASTTTTEAPTTEAPTTLTTLTTLTTAAPTTTTTTSTTTKKQHKVEVDVIGGGGHTDHDGITMVDDGDTVVITITADAGCDLDALSVNGATVSIGGNVLTLTNVTGDRLVEVMFVCASSTETTRTTVTTSTTEATTTTGTTETTGTSTTVTTAEPTTVTTAEPTTVTTAEPTTVTTAEPTTVTTAEPTTVTTAEPTTTTTTEEPATTVSPGVWCNKEIDKDYTPACDPSTGLYGDPMNVKVTACTYTSTISQADADAQADAAAQDYADKNGFCHTTTTVITHTVDVRRPDEDMADCSLDKLGVNVVPDGGDLTVTFTYPNDEHRKDCSSGRQCVLMAGGTNYNDSCIDAPVLDGSNAYFPGVVYEGTRDATTGELTSFTLKNITTDLVLYVSCTCKHSCGNDAIDKEYTPACDPASGSYGTPIQVQIPANTYYAWNCYGGDNSAANALAEAAAQDYANKNGVCYTTTAPLVGNDQQCATATRNNCATCQNGSSVQMCVAANTYFDVTKAAANQKAIDYLTANKQNYANTNGTCTSYTTSANWVYVSSTCSGTTETATYQDKAVCSPTYGQTKKETYTNSTSCGYVATTTTTVKLVCNTAQTATATKNNCASGCSVSSTCKASYTRAAGTDCWNYGYLTQAEADAFALSTAQNYAQSAANALSDSSCCSGTVWKDTGNYRCSSTATGCLTASGTGNYRCKEQKNACNTSQTQWVQECTNCGSCVTTCVSTWKDSGNYRCSSTATGCLTASGTGNYRCKEQYDSCDSSKKQWVQECTNCGSCTTTTAATTAGCAVTSSNTSYGTCGSNSVMTSCSGQTFRVTVTTSGSGNIAISNAYMDYGGTKIGSATYYNSSSKTAYFDLNLNGYSSPVSGYVTWTVNQVGRSDCSFTQRTYMTITF